MLYYIREVWNEMPTKNVVATTKAARQGYVTANMGMYWDFLTEVANGPFSEIEKMAFACISANTAMGGAIDGFLATLNKVGVTEIAEALLFWGVNAPFKKAAYIAGIREVPDYMIPNPDVDMIEQRELYVPEIVGLGYAKYSFAASLITPFESTICCIDTHMYQTLTGRIPHKGVYGRSKKALADYIELEDILRREAKEIDAPVFLYQWAVWDLQRKISQGSPVELHDFLWSRGREHFQITMDGLALAV